MGGRWRPRGEPRIWEANAPDPEGPELRGCGREEVLRGRTERTKRPGECGLGVWWGMWYAGGLAGV